MIVICLFLTIHHTKTKTKNINFRLNDYLEVFSTSGDIRAVEALGNYIFPFLIFPPSPPFLFPPFLLSYPSSPLFPLSFLCSFSSFLLSLFLFTLFFFFLGASITDTTSNIIAQAPPEEVLDEVYELVENLEMTLLCSKTCGEEASVILVLIFYFCLYLCWLLLLGNLWRRSK